MPKTTTATLTAKAIERAIKDRNKLNGQSTNERLTLWDGVVDGLSVRIGKHGNASYSVVYRTVGNGPDSQITGRPTAGRQRRMTLGRHPNTSLNDARKKAQEALKLAQEGIDPQDARDHDRRERRDKTFADIAELYLSRYADRHLHKAHDIRRHFDLHLLPHLARSSFKNLERADLVDVINYHIDRDAVGTAREARKYLSAMYSWAVDEGLAQANIISGYKIKTNNIPKDDGRVLTPDELNLLWHGAEEIGYPFGPWLQLLMLTGLRLREWANATWDEIKLDAGSISVEIGRYKQRRKNSTPLVGTAKEIVNALPRYNGGPYLFSARGANGEQSIKGFSKAKKKIDKVSGVENWTFHDLRRSFRTYVEKSAAISGVSQPDRIAELLIGHSILSSLESTYNKNLYWDEQCKALEAYEAWLMQVINAPRP
ncbi:MAG: integrase arm-type DNA-binding domain-containing protein [Pseudomonadota bacterium]